MRCLLLLPSSESKAEGGAGSWDPDGDTPTLLGPARRQVATALRTAMDDPATAARITGVKGSAHDRARAANLAAVGGPALPAGARYRGVVWDHLDPATLPAAALRHARGGVVVVSALTGVARFGDPIPDYKLKMSARLDPLGGLARFWREPVTEAVAWWAHTAKVVVDLLPLDHARAVDFDRLPAPTIHVELTTSSGRAAGHGAKAAKGRLARHLLTTSGDPRKALRSFSWEGWRTRTSHDPNHFEVTFDP